MTMSVEAQRVLYQQETGDYPIILLTIDHADLAQPIRVSTDPTQRLSSLTTDQHVVYGTISLGNEYVFYPVEVAWPTTDEESPPATTLTVANIGRELISTIRTLETSPTIGMALVLASDPDTIESEFNGFLFTDISIDAYTVKGSLTIDTGATEPFPHLLFTPSTAPGSFKG